MRKIIVIAAMAISIEFVLRYQMEKPDKTMGEVFHDLCVESTGNAGCDPTNTTPASALIEKSERQARDQR